MKGIRGWWFNVDQLTHTRSHSHWRLLLWERKGSETSVVKDFANNNEDIFMELDSFGTICLNYCDIFWLDFFFHCMFFSLVFFVSVSVSFIPLFYVPNRFSCFARNLPRMSTTNLCVLKLFCHIFSALFRLVGIFCFHFMIGWIISPSIIQNGIKQYIQDSLCSHK